MNIDLNEIKKVLIIQIRPFGDVLLNTPYFPFLRKKLPNAKIDFLVCRPYHKILENNPYIDEMIVFNKRKGVRNLFERVKLLARINHRKYDCIIDQVQGTSSALITLFSKAKYRIAYSHARWKFLYNIRVIPEKQLYSASMKFYLLKPLGIEESPYQFYYHIKPESIAYIDKWMAKANLTGQKFICLSPGSPRNRKKWKGENYAKLADLILKKTDRKVVLLWGPDEKDDVINVSNAMEKKPIVALPTNFNEAAAMLNKCELLICNDGGLNHLSVAVGTASLAIFGNTNPLNWSPHNFFGHYYLFNENFNSSKDNSFGISPETAFEKVKLILSEIESGRQF
jgi:ADP-heptose:LPS heptosyltransferase